jgi:hypothetical protein
LFRRRFRGEFKLAAIERLEERVSVAELARAPEPDINPTVLHRWQTGVPRLGRGLRHVIEDPPDKISEVAIHPLHPSTAQAFCKRARSWAAIGVQHQYHFVWLERVGPKKRTVRGVFVRLRAQLDCTAVAIRIPWPPNAGVGGGGV